MSLRPTSNSSLRGRERRLNHVRKLNQETQYPGVMFHWYARWLSSPTAMSSQYVIFAAMHLVLY
jgi:hypothetical protein